MKRLIIALSLLAISVSAQAGFTCEKIKEKKTREECIADRAEKDLRQEVLNKVREIIKSGLKDPDSAKFRNEMIYAEKTVCGEFNAKNSYGGYTGFKRYIFQTSGAFSVETDDNNLIFQDWWKSNCRPDAVDSSAQ